MKRLHLHVAVDDLEHSTHFYSALFGARPTVAKADYAKWMLEDPRLNFAISARGAKPGLDHLGIQVEDAKELDALRMQFVEADLETHSSGETVCCYARSDKTWLRDPSGLAWEAYQTMGEATLFNGGEETAKAPEATAPEAMSAAAACCVPKSGGGGCC